MRSSTAIRNTAGQSHFFCTMEGFLEKLKVNPTDVISDDKDGAREPLSLAKSYIDSTLEDYQRLEKEEEEADGGVHKRSAIDQIVVDGLDANQVWWQVKLVVDNVGGDLLRRIQEYSTAVKGEESYSSAETGGSEELGSDMEVTGSETPSDNEEEEDDDVLAENDDIQIGESQLELKEDSEALSDLEEEGSEVPQESDDTGSPDNTEKADHTNLDHTFNSDEEEEEDESDKNEERSFNENDPNSLNDEFFNLEEFNRQTLAQENDLDNEEEDEGDDEEEIDYFADIPSDEDEEAIYYDDFFDKPTLRKPQRRTGSSKGDNVPELETDSGSALQSLKKDLFEEPESEEISDEEAEQETGSTTTNTKKLSTFEKQQLEIQKQIKQLEEEAVAEKKWALKGEVKAKDRPDDALLTEDLDFERTAKPVPVITNEVSVSLEDMIRRRIQDYNFDDLPRRTIVDMSKNRVKLDFELSDVKSGKSLAELYEDDYKGIDQNQEVSEALQKSHDEISELYKKICYKLDALSSAHFVPKPAQKSLEVRVESSTVVMEDAQPLTMSTSSTLAPQEVYKAGKAESPSEIRLKDGTVMARDELTREDKSRIRRANKRRYAKSVAVAAATASSAAQQPAKKKSKTDSVIKTLSQAKNVTIVNSKGEKYDTKGNVKAKTLKSGSSSFKL